MLQNEKDISLFTVVERDNLPDNEPFFLTRSLVLSKCLSWKLFIHGKAANHLPALSCIGEVLNLELFEKLMGILCNSNIYTGNTDEKYILCHILDTKLSLIRLS